VRNLSAQLVSAFRSSGSVQARTRRAELALLLLAVVVLAAGCSGPSAMSSARTPPAPSTPAAVPPTTAFVLTQSQSSGVSATGMLSAVALRGGRVLWSASIPGYTAGLVVAPRLGRAYVLAGQPFTLTPVSLSTGAVGRPISLGPTVWSVALAPDGTTAYVVNAGTGIADLPGPTGSTITPVNLRAGRADPAISVGDGPCGIAFAGDDTAYVSRPLAGRVTPVNLAAGRTGPGVAVPPALGWQAVAPCTVAVAADAGLLAVGNLQQDLASPAPVVDLLDLASHRWRRPITLPGTSNAVYQLGFSPDARHVYVSARTGGGLTDTLYIASIATGTLTQARLTGEVVTFAPTPDGGTLWVAASTGKAEGETALLPVNAATGVPGPAVVDLPGGPVAIGL
jgi:DNA-binding beta-propeller fold protein YncE